MREVALSPKTVSSPLRIACRRHDWSNALFDGRIDEPSMAFLPEAHLELASLLDDPPAVDLMECGLVNFCQARAAGAPIRALPVFLRAAFRHNYIFVNARAGIATPQDLEGKRVGTRYGMTANVWARALLQHQYGVRLERIRWLNQETRPVTPYVLPEGLVLEPAGRDVDLRALVASGEIDALIHPDVIPTKLTASGAVKRLFANPADEERAYYRRFKVVPVMNVVAFREADLNARPETIAAVFATFRRAKALGLEAMQDVRDSGLLWYYEALEAQIALLGPDPVPYALEAMRPTLEAFLAHGLEQGVFPRRLALEELFWEPPS